MRFNPLDSQLATQTFVQIYVLEATWLLFIFLQISIHVRESLGPQSHLRQPDGELSFLQSLLWRHAPYHVHGHVPSKQHVRRFLLQRERG